MIKTLLCIILCLGLLGCNIEQDPPGAYALINNLYDLIHVLERNEKVFLNYANLQTGFNSGVVQRLEEQQREIDILKQTCRRGSK